MGLSDWQGVARPQRVILKGRYTRLEPLDPARHSLSLFAAATEGGDERFRYLFDRLPATYEDQLAWAITAKASEDPLFFAVIDRKSQRAEGRQALMRIDTKHGVIEIGNICWGPWIAKTRIATEAFYLMARYVFEDLNYRRFEWKCDNQNAPSKRAAKRFGFNYDGVFRQHMVVKGLNRDTAWFSMLDSDWPKLKQGYDQWLAPENFDELGRQRVKLESLTTA